MMAIVLTLLVTTPHVDALIEQGVELRRQRRDEAALDKFKEAYRKAKAKRGRALAQVALAEQALGRWLEAEVHLQRALRYARDPWIGRHKSALRQSLKSIRKNLISVDVRASVTGAEISINGRFVGRHPLDKPVRAVAGTVVIRVAAPGYWPLTRTRELGGGLTAREVFELVPIPAEQSEGTKTDEIRGRVPPEDARGRVPPEDARGRVPPEDARGRVPPEDARGRVPPEDARGRVPPEDARGRVPPEDARGRVPPAGPNLAPYAYTAAGFSLAAAGTGVGLVFVRNGHARDLRACLRNAGSDCENDRTAAETAETAMIGAFIGAGALAVTAVLLFVFDGDREPTTPMPHCGPAPEVSGISCAVRF